MQHFRSFSEETVLRFRPGLNLLVGANGAGKSNVLDAVLFALTQEAAKLRARSWGELTNRAQRGPCAVSLRIALPDESISILAFVKDESNRVLKLNDKAATVGSVRAALRQARLDVENTTFAIRQHAAARVLDGTHLISLLQQASGASTFEAAVKESEAKLDKEREALLSVRRDVATLEEMMATERVAADALRQLLELRGKLRRGRAGRQSAGERLLALAAAVQERAGRAATQRVDELRGEAVALEAAASRQRAEQQDAQKALRERTAAVGALRSEAVAVADMASEAEAMLVDSLVQREWRQAEVREAAGEGGGEAGAHRLQARAARLRGQLHALQAAQVELEAEAEKQRHEAGGREAHESKKRPPGPKRQRMDGVDGEAERRGRAEAARNELRTTRDELDEATRASAAAADAAREAENRVEAAEAARCQATAALETLTEAAMAAARSVAEAPESERTNVSGLRAALQRSTAAAASAAAARKQAEGRLRHLDPPTDEAAGTRAKAPSVAATAPTLASVLRLRDGAGGVQLHLNALHVLAGRHLPVRLTRTSEEAWPVLDAARKGGRSVRVWPLERLSVRDHTASQRGIQAEFGAARVVLPIELLEHDPAWAGAVRHALGRTLLVHGDELAAEIVRKHGCPCVTLEGTRHERGKMHGGYRGEATSSFALLLERQRAVQASERADGAVRAAKARLHAVQASASADEARLRADVAVEEAQRTKEARATEARLRAEAAAEEAQRVECATARVAAAEAEVTILEGSCEGGAGDSGGSGGAAGGGEWREQLQRLHEERVAAVRAQVAAATRELHSVEEAAVADGALQQLRRSEARALDEQLEELARAGQQAASTLAAQDRALASLGERAIKATAEAAAASAMAAALAKTVAETTERRGEAEAELRRAEAAALAAASQQQPVAVARAVDTDSDESDDDGSGGEEECGGDDGVDQGDSGERGGGVAGPVDEEAATAAEVAAQEARLEEMQIEIRLWARQRQEIEHEHGCTGELRRKLAAQGGATGLVARLRALQEKEQTIGVSIETLRSGIAQMERRVLQADLSAFAAVRDQLKANFEGLVPTKQIAIECVDEQRVAAGVVFKLRDRKAADGGRRGAGRAAGGGSAPTADDGDRGDEGRGEWRAGLAELSGGQNTLLNVSALLAVAKLRPSLVLLMDEIDAALDEHNTQRVARMLKDLSRQTQVIAISHRKEFHALADHIVRLHAADGRTVATSDR